jgi:hypothetical protein
MCACGSVAEKNGAHQQLDESDLPKLRSHTCLLPPGTHSITISSTNIASMVDKMRSLPTDGTNLEVTAFAKQFINFA